MIKRVNFDSASGKDRLVRDQFFERALPMEATGQKIDGVSSIWKRKAVERKRAAGYLDNDFGGVH